LIVKRRAFTAALSLTGAAALVGPCPFGLTTKVLANGTADNVADAATLPDMALGSVDAPVTIAEYASITCPHCAAFNENVFPKIKAAYIDTGKVRYHFREFPLDAAAIASSVLSRCIADGDPAKYFEITDALFKQQWSKVNPREALNQVGKQAGLDEHRVGACLQDETMFNKIVAGRIAAAAKLGINSTPTFLVNDDKIVGVTPFEEFDRRIKALLKG
jgi:protein-disulfide isomerase